jgi:hypothetical protein
MTDQQPSDPQADSRTPLQVSPLKVVQFAGRDDEIELSLVQIPGGNGVMAQAEAEGREAGCRLHGRAQPHGLRRSRRHPRGR